MSQCLVLARTLTVLAVFLVSPFHSVHAAAIDPEKVHTAEAKKNKFYIKDGLFIGGDQAIADVSISDIRFSANHSANPHEGFERIVIDLTGNLQGEPSAIARPPYYQVSVLQYQKRLDFSIWGKPKLSFQSHRILSQIKKSGAIKSMSLLPNLDHQSWTFSVHLRKPAPVEVFELSNPARIIVDIRADSVAGNPLVNTTVRATHKQFLSKSAKKHSPVSQPRDHTHESSEDGSKLEEGEEGN